jgi:ribosomal protein L21E
LNFKYEVTGDDVLMYTKKWMQAQRLARIHLFKAQEKQKFHYNLGTVATMYEVGDWVLLKAPPMVGKFINRWNGPYQITKNFSKVYYEIENLQDKKQKRMVVHVNRIKKFNPREDTTLTSQNDQRFQILKTDTHRTEEERINNDPPPTTVRRGRGHPRKNTTQASEPKPTYQNHKAPNLTTQNQNKQNTRQSRQPEGFRNNRRNQTHRFIKDLYPHWRGRLRSSPNDPHSYQHNCHCPRCLSLRSERQGQATEIYQSPQSFRPETTRREIPFQNRYNLRSRHKKKLKKKNERGTIVNIAFSIPNRWQNIYSYSSTNYSSHFQHYP